MPSVDIASFGARGRSMLWAQTCTVKRASGDASLHGNLETIHDSLNCTRVYEASDEERERWFLTTATRALKIYTDKPSTGTIKEGDQVYVNSERYNVVKANRWPHSNPSYFELFVEYRRGQS